MAVNLSDVSAPQRQPNRLAQETSPYLLQHARNPVDWYPWGEEAFARARAEQKPILLSVGYSACHWCHVMERESFENEAIAAQMNRDFVNIKVDREERPDVDAIYMSAVQLMTGQGGWPMTMFLTPEGKPFYGGTYFPPHDLYGRPGFPRVLEVVAEAWRKQRLDIEAQSGEIISQLQRGEDFTRGLPDVLLTPAVLENAYNTLSGQFDRHYGGFGSAPKFPLPANLDFLLRFHARSNQQEPLAMVEKTLQRMALGGIYDQLGGGFHRYSTDQTWLVPHFEKMLYDNAQLAQTYARCWQATGKSFYRGVAEEILEYVLREMTGPEGGFYSAQDADSEGEEGKFFVWTPAEVAAVLGERDAEAFCAFYDVTARGNWEGRNILHVTLDADEVAARFGLTVPQAAQILDEGRVRLLEAREKRVKPGLDDKTLTSWNGLMLAAFAECAAVFDRDDFRQAAIRNARFVLGALLTRDAQGNPRLLHTYRNGQARLNAYAEDYAFYADGLLWLYEATFDPQWLDAAQQLIDTLLARYWDERAGGFFATSDDHETLIQRPKDWDDNATPGANSVAVEVMLKLALLRGEERYRQAAARVLRKLGPVLEKHPYGFARMLGALDLYLSTPKEIAIIGSADDPATRALLGVVYGAYLPNKVVVGAPEDGAPPNIPLLADRPQRDGKPTAYVCQNYACQAPVTEPEALEQQLRP
jgi:uncharacterized protein YyaL (SSP411 family)